MKFTAHLKNTYKFGIIMGLGFCFYTIFMWLTKLDTTYLKIGQHFDKAIIIWPILIIMMAIWQANKLSRIPILHRVALAVFIGLNSFIIYDPFLYAYHQFINPDWFEAVLRLEEERLIAASTDPVSIGMQLQKMKDFNVAQSSLFRLNALLPSVIIIPTLIALLSLIFIRKNRDEQIN
jgi:hypothetical protein